MKKHIITFSIEENILEQQNGYNKYLKKDTEYNQDLKNKIIDIFEKYLSNIDIEKEIGIKFLRECENRKVFKAEFFILSSDKIKEIIKNNSFPMRKKTGFSLSVPYRIVSEFFFKNHSIKLFIECLFETNKKDIKLEMIKNGEYKIEFFIISKEKSKRIINIIERRKINN